MSEWTRCAPWIEAALEHAHGSHNLDDVYEMVMDGECQFWPGKRSASVTQIQVFPRLKRMHMWLCGGDMTEILDMLPSAEAYGAARGCTQFTTAGRPGWDKVMRPHGYEPAYRVCMKEI
jgi:hypothetical protein